jgi:glucans biosynthesis protein
VEPRGAWGEGFVDLIEIPADEEIHDNIVAYWRPTRTIEAAKPYTLAYRLHWGDSIPVAWSGARVRKTRVGNTRKGLVMFIVDFDGPALKDRELPVADVRANSGTVANVVAHRHPEIGGMRCSFELQTGPADLIELRLVLKSGEQVVSETWLYRWTRS